jgi:uncharacterized protein YoxC
MILNLWFTIALVLTMLSLIAVSIYLITALVQIKKTAKEAEMVLQKINVELAVVNKVSGKVSDIADKVSAPLLSAVSVLAYIISGIAKKKKKCVEE